MDLTHLPSVDSTSSEAARQLAGGRRPPFAVSAATQTGGRGRRGTAWVSPPGNLHLTVALPPPGPASEGGLLPLRAGVVVARAVERHAGWRVTLKWPNDLLLGGKKLGGLLLEGSVSGNAQGDLCVGIGLNLNQAPELPGSYQAASLAAATGRREDAQVWAERLAAAFEEHWDQLGSTDVRAAYADYAPEAGQLWAGDDRTMARATGIRADGALLLTPLAGGAELALTSVDHGWRWLYQGTQAAPLAVADVGNSATKIAWYAGARDGAPARTFVARHGDQVTLDNALRDVAALAPARPWPLLVLSVNAAAGAALSARAAAAGLNTVPIAKRPVRRHGDGYVLSDLGADRLAAIEGWLAAHGTPAKPGYGLVVAAGTATTVDVVTTDGRHLGGLILPGLSTATASLHAAAPALPLVDMAPAGGDDALGHDTRSAISAAALSMTLGAIERAARAGAAASGLPPATPGVLVTGGHGRPLAMRLGAPYDEALVLSGARIMAVGGL